MLGQEFIRQLQYGVRKPCSSGARRECECRTPPFCASLAGVASESSRRRIAFSTQGGSASGMTAATPGIYHITNTGSCTWYEYAKAAVESAGVVAEVVPVGPGNFPRKAKRPARVALLNAKLPPLRPWQEALKEFFSQTK